jgi:DNA modification methylase
MAANASVIGQIVTDRYALYHGDCIEVARGMPADSVHLSVFSPPFGSLYSYTDALQDMSNVRTEAEFFAGFDFLVAELARVIMPGRIVAFHCMNLPSTIERDGFIGIRDFRGDLIRAFLGEDALTMLRAISSLRTRAFQAGIAGDISRERELSDAAKLIQNDLTTHPCKSGFIYHSEVVIWKDPLIAATRTHALGLAHKQIVKDSSLCRVGIPDYLIAMRKPGKNPEAVTHQPSGFDRWIGPPEREPKAEKKKEPGKNKYSHEVWQRYASPVWFDIDPSDTLQRQSAREEDDARHICPLQLTVIRRAIELWSNPGDTVFSPFAGIGSEGYVAVAEGRRFVGAELKETYYRQAAANLEIGLKLKDQGTMFERLAGTDNSDSPHVKPGEEGAE